MKDTTKASRDADAGAILSSRNMVRIEFASVGIRIYMPDFVGRHMPPLLQITRQIVSRNMMDVNERLAIPGRQLGHPPPVPGRFQNVKRIEDHQRRMEPPQPEESRVYRRRVVDMQHADPP